MNASRAAAGGRLKPLLLANFILGTLVISMTLMIHTMGLIALIPFRIGEHF